MPKILIVKTSSLGDVVHALPAVSDMRTAVANATITWAVEEAFSAIPRLHPGVSRVIPVAIRRWRWRLWDRGVRDEVREMLELLRDTEYDYVIDTQGLLKSALLARAARGRRYGLDWKSAREPLAVFYDRTFNVPWGQHAVERNRSLAGQALRYKPPAGVDYGIGMEMPWFPWLPAGDYAVLLHATSAPEKQWRERDWVRLGNELGGWKGEAKHERQARDADTGRAARGGRRSDHWSNDERALAVDVAEHGLRCVLPWGNERERARSERIAANIPNAVVPPALTLAEAAGLLSGARAIFGVDTGLSHLAVALGRPTVGIYCATDPRATGLYGSARAVNVGGLGHRPQVEEVLAAFGSVRIANPAGMSSMT